MKSKIDRVRRSSANKSTSFRTSALRIFCCGFQRGQLLNRCSASRLVRTPPALRGGPVLRPLEVCLVRQCTVFSWQNRPANHFELPATALFGRCLSGILYFLAVIRSSAQRRASVHFFSEISRLRFATWCLRFLFLYLDIYSLIACDLSRSWRCT
jgi:hypothetical protein